LLSETCQTNRAGSSMLVGMHDDPERCLRAVQSKDARFDGWFFTAVVTTGI
jgi:AraC family transcriptional regulator of adaptative response / DNA-3-methyladenine glycosylase II